MAETNTVIKHVLLTLGVRSYVDGQIKCCCVLQAAGPTIFPIFQYHLEICCSECKK